MEQKNKTEHTGFESEQSGLNADGPRREEKEIAAQRSWLSFLQNRVMGKWKFSTRSLPGLDSDMHIRACLHNNVMFTGAELLSLHATAGLG